MTNLDSWEMWEEVLGLELLKYLLKTPNEWQQLVIIHEDIDAIVPCTIVQLQDIAFKLKSRGVVEVIKAWTLIGEEWESEAVMAKSTLYGVMWMRQIHGSHKE